MIDDIPSGKRIWELASEAIRIEATAYNEDITKEEVYSSILSRNADSIEKTLAPNERQFFETVLDVVCGTVGHEDALNAVAQEIDSLIHRLDERLADTSEDSYATRNELREEIAQFRQISHEVRSAPLGKSVDLTERIVDYGYDAEAAAADRMCGLEYVSDFQRAIEVYESAIEKIKPLIEKLQRAGIEVKTGVIAVEPPDYEDEFKAMVRAENECLEERSLGVRGKLPRIHASLTQMWATQRTQSEQGMER
jgi:predicted Fe-Mo cluster-binding NifX family protein